MTKSAENRIDRGSEASLADRFCNVFESLGRHEVLDIALVERKARQISLQAAQSNLMVIRTFVMITFLIRTSYLNKSFDSGGGIW